MVVIYPFWQGSTLVVKVGFNPRIVSRIWAAVLFAGSVSLSAADWPTFGHDPQRTGWAVEETALRRENVARLELKWKAQVKNEARFLHALTAPLVGTDVATFQGTKTLVYVAGSSNNVFALDAVDGSVVWSRQFTTRLAAVGGDYQGTFLCPNGITATPVIDRSLNAIYVIGADGRLYGLDLSTGKDHFAPIPFIAPFSKSWSLNLVDGRIYTALSQGCGDAESGFYSIDVKDPHRPLVRRLLLSNTDTAGIWGRGGPVAGENGRIYGQTADGGFDPAAGDYSNSVVSALLPDLALADYFTPLDWQAISKADLDMGAASPAWFRYKNRNLVVGGGKQAVVYLMDAESLGGRDHHTPVSVTPQLGNDGRSYKEAGIWGELSTWQDEQGERWIYVPMWGAVSKQAPTFRQVNGPNPHGSVMAFKVALDAPTQRPSLEPAWISGDFNLPDPVAIANGVVFVVSTGENANQETDRSLDTRPAVLYALDAKTGETLWNSGGAMQGWVHFSGLAIANGRVYAVDHDSRVYCFGLKDH